MLIGAFNFVLLEALKEEGGEHEENSMICMVSCGRLPDVDGHCGELFKMASMQWLFHVH